MTRYDLLIRGGVAVLPWGMEQTDIGISLTPREQWTKAKTPQELSQQIKEKVWPLVRANVSITQPIKDTVRKAEDEQHKVDARGVTLGEVGRQVDAKRAVAERAVRDHRGRLALLGEPPPGDLAVERRQ